MFIDYHFRGSCYSRLAGTPILPGLGFCFVRVPKEGLMAEIIARHGNEVPLQVTLKLSGSLLEMENVILDQYLRH